MSRHILVVDDDAGVRTAVSWRLQADGYSVSEAPDGTSALEQIQSATPDLVILDLGLPGVGGLDVLRKVRYDGRANPARQLPIIVLSGHGAETDRVVGLDLGADDYLVKPFSIGELAARIRSVLRRVDPMAWSTGAEPSSAGLYMEEAAREVAVDGTVVDLTAKEFDLLAFLWRHPRQVFTRADLLHHVWSSAPDWQCEATVTEHVHRLRQKLEHDQPHQRWIRTVRGVGYRLEP
ncbi:MAG: response regulator transcription factor [Acidimicrobiales bacterium]